MPPPPTPSKLSLQAATFILWWHYKATLCCSPTPPPPSSFYPTVVLFSTLESCCRYSAVLCEMADEWRGLYRSDVKNEQRIDEGVKKKHARPRQCCSWARTDVPGMFRVSLCMEHLSVVHLSIQQVWVWPMDSQLMKINEAPALHLPQIQTRFHHNAKTHLSFSSAQVQQIIIYWTALLSMSNLYHPAFGCL